MSRRIAVALYREIAALRPEWTADTDDAGALKDWAAITQALSFYKDHMQAKAWREWSQFGVIQDPATGALLASFPVGGLSPRSLVFDGASVWILCSDLGVGGNYSAILKLVGSPAAT